MTERLSDHEGTGQDDGEHRGPTVRDRRRIDPETYQVREPQETAAPDLDPADDAPMTKEYAEVTELKAGPGRADQ